MDKTKKIVITVIAVLAVVLIIAAVLNKQGLDERKDMLTNAKISIKLDGEEVGVLAFEDIKTVGEEEFEAVLDTSNTEPQTFTYTGVQLKNILEKYDIDLSKSKAVILMAVDGYTVAYSTDEVLQEGNVYVAYKKDRKFLLTKEEGGRGPYQTIVASDQFSNRRCKWLTTIEVQQ